MTFAHRQLFPVFVLPFFGWWGNIPRPDYRKHCSPNYVIVPRNPILGPYSRTSCHLGPPLRVPDPDQSSERPAVDWRLRTGCRNRRTWTRTKPKWKTKEPPPPRNEDPRASVFWQRDADSTSVWVSFSRTTFSDFMERCPTTSVPALGSLLGPVAVPPPTHLDLCGRLGMS